MKVEFLAKFNKDLDKIYLAHVKHAVAKAIVEVEAAQNIQQVGNVKKLKGTKTAYRIRIGDYRIGFYYERGIVQFARVVHRKDIYKVFP
jgi:mRNA interferase RelE/StbE